MVDFIFKNANWPEFDFEKNEYQRFGKQKRTFFMETQKVHDNEILKSVISELPLRSIQLDYSECKGALFMSWSTWTQPAFICSKLQ